MRKTIYLSILFIGVLFLFSGCVAYHNGLTSNANLHSTDVVLTKKNFKVIDAVYGEAKASYFLGFGGITKKALVAQAKANMLAKANIVGSSKAIINETVELTFSRILFVRKYKVTVSGHIVEFLE